MENSDEKIFSRDAMSSFYIDITIGFVLTETHRLQLLHKNGTAGDQLQNSAVIFKFEDELKGRCDALVEHQRIGSSVSTRDD